MTIDEMIKHCEELAEKNILAVGMYEILAENNHNAYEKLTAETNSSQCAEYASELRQIADWLLELKEAKWLLKLAVYGFKYLGAEWMDHEDRCTLDCSICPLHNGYNCSHWKMQEEALKLIGGEIDD